MGLDLGLLQAGASVKGEFENRLKHVIDEVKAPEAHHPLHRRGAHHHRRGRPQGGGDAANLLKPALARGELRTIAATTWSEYKKYFEKDAALERRFQPVKVDEPSEENAIDSCSAACDPSSRRRTRSSSRDEAVTAAVKLSAATSPAASCPTRPSISSTRAARA
jgi:type VI secretion system protein VasG